ncbi:glycosyl transferase, partial [Enterobacter cloacae]|nr:glycosyl transferase [Enterobacter cloacae]
VLSNHISYETFLRFFVLRLLIVVLVFLDDHGHLVARWRLLLLFLAAAIGLYLLGTFADIDIFGYVFSLSWLGIIIVSVYLVWMLNLYNFMDGINGLASSQAITFSLCSVVIITLSQNAGSPDAMTMIALALAGAAAGFIVWNFPVARIF